MMTGKLVVKDKWDACDHHAGDDGYCAPPGIPRELWPAYERAKEEDSACHAGYATEEARDKALVALGHAALRILDPGRTHGTACLGCGDPTQAEPTGVPALCPGCREVYAAGGIYIRESFDMISRCVGPAAKAWAGGA